MKKEVYEKALQIDSGLELARFMFRNGYKLSEINKWPEDLRKKYYDLSGDDEFDFDICVDYF
ncbi:hypothetical protein [uncultured Pseudoramibacter sp.]|uniref:hypothetical protein n=1 Tax=uncultured Pseudoramibacter sp. TaxID=1623493 RepID=UPI0025F489CD|nr:hypothetical protein [uncultured Pseudoramibacter sp.]